MIDDMMKNSWLKWTIIISTPIVLAVILLGVPIILNYALGHKVPFNLEVIGTEVNWLNFWGSYISAIIGGLITLIPMKRETDRNALNIMINNQENYIKELKSQLGNHICNLNFKLIGEVELPIMKNNQHIDENRVSDIIQRLNNTSDGVKSQLDSWCIIYSDETGKAGNFKRAYKKCVGEFIEDVKKITDILKDVINNKDKEIKEKKEQWTSQIVAFRKELGEHQESHRQAMLNAAQDWLNEEQKELEKLRNQLKSFYPRIK